MKLRTILPLFVVLPFLAANAQQPPQAPAAPAVEDGPVDPNKPVWAYAVAPGQGGPRGGGAPGGRRGGGAPGAPGDPAAAGGGPRGGGRGAPADQPKLSLAGSRFQFTMAEIRNQFGPADWFPEDHPPMPEVMAHGRAPNARACAFCHMPNGKGRPENGPISGLPKDYIIRQMKEYASGARDTAEPRKPKDMLQISQNISEQDMEEVATYLASMPWTPWIRVVETDTVKTTRIAGQMFHLVDDGKTEPIGQRIVEVIEDEAVETLRAPRTGFIAYVPTGAIKKGEVLVTTGGGKTVPCITCHGLDLKGMATIPGIANRGPSYLARQLYDFQTGARHGEWAALMKPVVEKLTNEDMVNILAYVSSRKPE